MVKLFLEQGGYRAAQQVLVLMCWQAFVGTAGPMSVGSFSAFTDTKW